MNQKFFAYCQSTFHTPSCIQIEVQFNFFFLSVTDRPLVRDLDKGEYLYSFYWNLKKSTSTMNPWWNRFFFFFFLRLRFIQTFLWPLEIEKGFPLFLLVQYVLAVVLFKAKKQLNDIVPGKWPFVSFVHLECSNIRKKKFQ